MHAITECASCRFVGAGFTAAKNSVQPVVGAEEIGLAADAQSVVLELLSAVMALRLVLL